MLSDDAPLLLRKHNMQKITIARLCSTPQYLCLFMFIFTFGAYLEADGGWVVLVYGDIMTGTGLTAC